MTKSKIQNLRKKYPKFVYKNYSYCTIGRNFKAVFDFRIEPGIFFSPEIIIENVYPELVERVDGKTLDNLVFHLGLIEIPSYWKTTCSPIIEIKAGYLNSDQIKWWKKLLIDGMGQFYFENKIDWRKKDFIKIDVRSDKISKSFNTKLKNRYLVPFAGGRDSIVTLESLKKPSFAKATEGKGKKEIALFTVNPIEKIQKTVKVSGIGKQIIVRRIIDEKLLEMNKQGFLNGHTPFTSLLSFLSVFCAVIFDYKNIAFSNEESADEGNVRYLGKIINHQWAKSSQFEKMFREYSKKYLAKNINYFSYLRKYNELEISKMLTKYPQYFPVFSSCNAGMKMNAIGTLHAKERWCGNCTKCLFVYLMLYPFLDKKQLLEIFGKDFFENRGLLSIMEELIGEKTIKPFECVGTKKESKMAFKLSLKKFLRQTQGKQLPYLLRKLK